MTFILDCNKVGLNTNTKINVTVFRYPLTEGFRHNI